MEDLHKFAWRACTVQQGVRLEKQRVFHVAFALCLSVSLVGGWLNESCGQRLRYKKLWFGFQGSFGGLLQKRKTDFVLVASGFLVHAAAAVMSHYLQDEAWNVSDTPQMARN